VNNIL